MAMSWGKVTAFTSDPAYPAILIPGPFGPGRGCYLWLCPGGRFTAPTSDPAYPTILFPEPFGPGRGC